MTMPTILSTPITGMQTFIANDAVSRTSATVSKPTGAAVGEHLLLIFHSGAGAPINVALSANPTLDGFIEIYNNTTLAYNDRIYTWIGIKAVEADEQADYTINFGTNTDHILMRVLRIQNLDPTLPIIGVSPILNSSGIVTATTRTYNTVEKDAFQLSVIATLRGNYLSQPGAGFPSNSTFVYNDRTASTAIGVAAGLAYRELPTTGAVSDTVWTNYLTTSGRGCAFNIVFRGKRALGTRNFFGYFPREFGVAGSLSAGATEYSYSHGDTSTLNSPIGTSFEIGPYQKIVAAYMMGVIAAQGSPGNARLTTYTANASTGDIEELLASYDIPINQVSSSNTAITWNGLEVDRRLLEEVGLTLKVVGGIGGISTAGRNTRIATYPVTSGISQRYTGAYPSPYPATDNFTSIIPMYFVVENIVDPTLISINGRSDTIGYGQTVDIETVGFSSALTAVSIGGRPVLSFTDDTATLWNLTDGAIVNAPGLRTFAITDGTVTDDMPVTVSAGANRAVTRLAGTLVTGPTSIINGFIPEAKLGDWIVFPTSMDVNGTPTPTNTNVLPSGEFETTILGSQLCYHLEDLGDGLAMVRSFPLTNGEVEGDPIIVSINNGVIYANGGTSTITVQNFDPVTSVSIAGVAVTGLAGSGNTYTFTNPSLTVGATLPAFGTVNVIVTAGATSRSILVNFLPSTTQNFFTLASTSTAEGTIGALSPVEIGDQFVMATPSSLGATVNRILAIGGVLESDHSGGQTIYRRRASTGVLSEIEIAGEASPFERIYNQLGYLEVSSGTLQSVDPRIVDVLLKREDFETGTFADKPWIVHQRGTYEYSTIVTDTDGQRAIRHMMNSNRTPAIEPAYVDPIGGRPSNGLYTSRFAIDQFYTPETHPHIMIHQWHRFDDSWWNTVDGHPYPIMTGKLFFESTDVGSDAWYLGLRNDGTLLVISGNRTAVGSPWSHVTDGGWCNRFYGWEDVGGAKRNNFTLVTPVNVFAADGVEYKLSHEIRYNPDNIGYNKARILINDVVCHSDNGVNTDEDGWFNLPPEYVARGMRFINAAGDIKSPQDSTTHPAEYDGIVGGLQISKHELWSIA